MSFDAYYLVENFVVHSLFSQRLVQEITLKSQSGYTPNKPWTVPIPNIKWPWNCFI